MSKQNINLQFKTINIAEPQLYAWQTNYNSSFGTHEFGDILITSSRKIDTFCKNDFVVALEGGKIQTGSGNDFIVCVTNNCDIDPGSENDIMIGSDTGNNIFRLNQSGQKTIYCKGKENTIFMDMDAQWTSSQEIWIYNFNPQQDKIKFFLMEGDINEILHIEESNETMDNVLFFEHKEEPAANLVTKDNYIYHKTCLDFSHISDLYHDISICFSNPQNEYIDLTCVGEDNAACWCEAITQP